MSISDPDYTDDKIIIIDLFKKIIAPDTSLSEFYENQVISWVDDIPFVNTWIVNNLNSIKKEKSFTPDALYKNDDDRLFAIDLFRKTVLNYHTYEKEIDLKTPNWDSERITKIDKLLIVMGITEFFSLCFNTDKSEY